MMTRQSSRMSGISVLATLLMAAFSLPALAAEKASEPLTLFTNVHVFDGLSDKRIENANVLVEGNLIKQVSNSAITAPGATVIDGAGRTLMPGLSDCHWHSMQANATNAEVLSAGFDYLTLRMAVGARATLMRGFTTIRDVGGPVFGLKKAIDEGLVEGPRIYPSGAYITQTSGHGDFRSPNDVPRALGRDLIYQEQIGIMAIADGVPQVIQRVRENLMKGATQIKVLSGGGMGSPLDPLDSTQFTEAELKAAVEAAKGWNTYVAVHTYTPQAIQAALRAGVKSIEHAQLLDDETAKMIAENGAVVCMQPFINDEDRIKYPEGSFSEQKWLKVSTGTENAYALAKQHKLKVGFGTDTQNDPDQARRQGAQLAKLVRWYQPAEVLRIGTSVNQEIFKMSGPRDPYPHENGIVKEGAYADLLLVDGNPLEDIQLIADPEKNFVVIMKDGVIYKNEL